MWYVRALIFHGAGLQQYLWSCDDNSLNVNLS